MLGMTAAVVRQMERLYRTGPVAGLSDGQLLDRFLAHRDEVAFEALVARHGLMVLAVCRQLLRDEHAVEDAFQATFLLLVRRAGSIRETEMLGGWLYRVAYRVALRARVLSARVQNREGQRPGEVPEPAIRTGADPDAFDLAAILHQELSRLPAKYRDPLVLCYLEGCTHDEAARRLRWPVGTVRGRLARGRDRLRTRLARLGALGSLVFPTASWPQPPKALAPALARATARAAVQAAGGQALTAGAVSAGTLALLQGASSTMRGRGFRLTAWGLVAVGATVMGRGWIAQAGFVAGTGPPRPGPASASPAPAADGPSVDAELARVLPGKLVKSVPIRKDCMILAYLPQWNFGNVDNIAVANNDGGVRTLIDWEPIADADRQAPGRRFVLALFSRKTTAMAAPGAVEAHLIQKGWPERTSWMIKPATVEPAAATYPFVPGAGWKLFDVTEVVKAQAAARARPLGVMLQFADEDRGEKDWSGYAFVSREGEGEFAGRRPVLLLVDPAE